VALHRRGNEPTEVRQLNRVSNRLQLDEVARQGYAADQIPKVDGNDPSVDG
jgi:hypothetical protein